MRTERHTERSCWLTQRQPEANIGRDLLAELGLKYGDTALVTVGGNTIPSKFVNTYGDVPEGDQQSSSKCRLVEISISMDDAKAAFGAQIGLLS